MKGTSVLSALSITACATVAIAQTNYTFDNIPSFTNLTWYPCNGNFQCARLDVPLDYSNPKGPYRASIPLMKLPAAAASTSYKGMLLANPGGPGESGITLIAKDGAIAQSVVGSNYDIVSWDPRGVGYSLPSGDCSALTTASRRGVKDVPKVQMSSLVGFMEQVVEVAKDWGQTCEKTIGQPGGIGPYVTTSDVVHDVISILDAYAASDESKGVEDPELLNYWGFSYGTFLGETFASMFPDRVGKVVLDGVLQPVEYISGLERSSVTMLDDVWALFFSYCNAAGPSACAVYTGSTPLDIYNRFEKSVLQLDAKHAVSQNWINATLIETALLWVRVYLFESSYSPISTYPTIPAFIIGLEEVLQNFTAVNIQTWQTSNGLGLPPSNDEIILSQVHNPLIAISCGDQGGAAYGKTLAQLESDIQKLEGESVIAGDFFSLVRVSCSQWPIIAKNIYKGPFCGDTKNPILFVSNTYDPVTPIADGQEWVKKFKNAQLLTVDAAGHTTLNALNKCAYGKIATFFQTGALPGADNFCAQEAGPWNVVLAGGLTKRDDVDDIKQRFGALQAMWK